MMSEKACKEKVFFLYVLLYIEIIDNLIFGFATNSCLHVNMRLLGISLYLNC